jgi:hypothetical protein
MQIKFPTRFNAGRLFFATGFYPDSPAALLESWRGFGSRAFVTIISTAIHSPLFDSGCPPVQYRRMEPAIRSIVDAYVRLRNRKALDDLRAHRGRLIAELRLLSGGHDTSKPIAQIQDEIAIIEAGLAKLNTATAA